MSVLLYLSENKNPETIIKSHRLFDILVNMLLLTSAYFWYKFRQSTDSYHFMSPHIFNLSDDGYLTDLFKNITMFSKIRIMIFPQFVYQMSIRWNKTLYILTEKKNNITEKSNIQQIGTSNIEVIAASYLQGVGINCLIYMYILF